MSWEYARPNVGRFGGFPQQIRRFGANKLTPWSPSASSSYLSPSIHILWLGEAQSRPDLKISCQKKTSMSTAQDEALFFKKSHHAQQSWRKYLTKGFSDGVCWVILFTSSFRNAFLVGLELGGVETCQDVLVCDKPFSPLHACCCFKWRSSKSAWCVDSHSTSYDQQFPKGTCSQIHGSTYSCQIPGESLPPFPLDCSPGSLPDCPPDSPPGCPPEFPNGSLPVSSPIEPHLHPAGIPFCLQQWAWVPSSPPTLGCPSGVFTGVFSARRKELAWSKPEGNRLGIWVVPNELATVVPEYAVSNFSRADAPWTKSTFFGNGSS